MEHEGACLDWCFWFRHQRIIKGTGKFGVWRRREYNLNYSIIEKVQNTEKCPGDFRKVAVTQTSVKNHQQMLI